MSSRAVRQARAKIEQTLPTLKLTLFGIASKGAAEILERHGRLQASRYGHLGLKYVPAAEMIAAVDHLFSALNLQPGERLVEVGPGPRGGIGLIAALTALHVVFVEHDEPFLIDVDRLKEELKASGSEMPAAIAHLTGSVSISQLENLKAVVAPYSPLVAAAGGSIRVVAGDFADGAVQRRAFDEGPFDHVICTDVVSPMSRSLSTTSAATTTGDEARAADILQGVVQLAAGAKTLYVSVVIPEESPEFKTAVEQLYGLLERALERHGRQVRYERLICPSSSTVIRSRLYHL